MGEGVFVHPTAIVESGQIGEGTRIWAFAHIMAGVSIGKHCNIGDHCFIESGVIVGSNVTLKNGNMLWDGVVLEDGVFLGPQAVFTNDLYPRSPRLAQAAQKYASRDWLLPTLVQREGCLGRCGGGHRGWQHPRRVLHGRRWGCGDQGRTLTCAGGRQPGSSVGLGLPVWSEVGLWGESRDVP